MSKESEAMSVCSWAIFTNKLYIQVMWWWTWDLKSQKTGSKKFKFRKVTMEKLDKLEIQRFNQNCQVYRHGHGNKKTKNQRENVNQDTLIHEELRNTKVLVTQKLQEQILHLPTKKPRKCKDTST